MKHNITAPIFIPHAGCPNQCIFCNQHIVTGKKNIQGETHSPAGSCIPSEKEIERTVDTYLAHAGTGVHRELAFFGGSFTGLDPATQEKLLGLALSYKRSGRIDAIRLSTRPDYISEEVLDRLRSFDVSTVELGVQSFDDAVLSAAKRGHAARQSLDAIGLLRARGFSFVIQLLPGLPFETRESAIESARTAAGLSPSGVRIYPAVVLAGTPMEELCLSGAYAPLTIDGAVGLCAAMTEIFAAQNIPVLKTGIHPLSDLGQGSVTAGPYHPAFGFLVRARVRRNELEKMIADAAQERRPRHIDVSLPGVLTEEYIGHRRENLLWLRERFPAITMNFTTDRSSTCPAIHCTD